MDRISSIRRLERQGKTPHRSMYAEDSLEWHLNRNLRRLTRGMPEAVREQVRAGVLENFHRTYCPGWPTQCQDPAAMNIMHSVQEHLRVINARRRT